MNRRDIAYCAWVIAESFEHVAAPYWLIHGEGCGLDTVVWC